MQPRSIKYRQIPTTAVIRPWGWYDSVASGANGIDFQVKRIYVNAGHSLSLQSHEYRSEHWVVVHGLATIGIGADLDSVIEQDYIHG